jgi:site-specific DNA recombinase
MITPVSIGRMAIATREGLRDDDGKYRRAHVRSVAQRVEVLSTVEIKIMGGRTELFRTMAASAGEHSVLVEVRSSKPKWRTRHDSNV